MHETPETQVPSLGGEGSLGKGMATHSNILAWRIPQREEPGWQQSMGSQKSRTQLSTHAPNTACIYGEYLMGFKEGPAAWGSLAGVGHQRRLTCLTSPLYVSRSVGSDSLQPHGL